ncbi:unnamed protein product, partial [Didymodactylos carnosus]
MSIYRGVCEIEVRLPDGFPKKVGTILKQISIDCKISLRKCRRLTGMLAASRYRWTKVKGNGRRIRQTIYSRRTGKRKKQQEEKEKSIEDVIIIWLDQNVNNQLPSKRKNNVRQIINSLKTFDNEEECLRYINEMVSSQFVPNWLCRTFIRKIGDFVHVLYVYVYCEAEDKHSSWTKTYSRIVGIYTNEHTLLTQITQDVSTFFQNSLTLSVVNTIDTSEKSVQDLTKDQAKFMYWQLLIETLLRLPRTSHTKQELFQECRQHYKSNAYQQEKI